MDRDMKIELLHQQQLMIKNDFLGFFFITINVGDELEHYELEFPLGSQQGLKNVKTHLVHRYIELFALSRQISRSDQDFFGMIVHDRIT